ncbi:Long-chain-fatty-acid--CoA ligase [Entamoeba marina]
MTVCICGKTSGFVYKDALFWSLVMQQSKYDTTYTEIDGDNLNILLREKYWLFGDKEDMDYMRTHSTYEIIKRRCEKNPEAPFMGYREKKGDEYEGDYIWLKNNQIIEMVDQLAAGILKKFKLSKGEFCGIISGNRYEWYLTQFALQRHGIIPVPLYTTLGSEAIDYILKKLNIKVVFCTYNDIFSVIFTSGTSGIPKGAVHTFKSIGHAAYVINSSNVFRNEPITRQTFFSYLPSAHCLDQQICHAFFYGGGKVGYISGGIQTLMDDIKYCKPTFFIGVPRVLQRIYDKFNEVINSSNFLTKNIYNIAYYYKRNAIVNSSWNYINWDAIVFNKVHELLGGEVRFILNGGAPITEELYEWLRVSTGATILQGYGLTETFGGCCCSLEEMTDLNVLNVGSSCPGVNIRLKSIPDMDYSVTDEFPSGEIQIKSVQNFREYYQNEEATKAAFTDDGYFCTGDIGRICVDGSLSIIDRKKNLFKLAQGEYVAVEPLENKYSSITLVEQCFIYGESTDTFIVAVLSEMNISCTSLIDVVEKLNEKKLRLKLMKMITDQVKTMKVPGYELIKNVYFEHEAFSTENDLMTPSFKPKRPQLKKKYSNILTELRHEVNNNLL